MTATTANFPAGEYVISDLCYVLSDDTWSELCELTFPPELNGKDVNGLFTLKDGRKLFMGSTQHGDGTYVDSLDNTYGVDSGTIGIMLVSDTEDTIDSGYSHVHTFEHPFTVEYANGNFSFGHIDIDTSWNHNDDYDDEEEFDDDWEE